MSPSTVVEDDEEEMSIQTDVLEGKKKRIVSIVKTNTSLVDVDYSSVGSESSSGTSVGDASRKTGAFSRKALREKRWVDLSKRTVFIFLFCLTATCAAATYFVTSNAEVDAMKEEVCVFSSARLPPITNHL
jgi:hypothetical protein